MEDPKSDDSLEDLLINSLEKEYNFRIEKSISSLNLVCKSHLSESEDENDYHKKTDRLLEEFSNYQGKKTTGAVISSSAIRRPGCDQLEEVNEIHEQIVFTGQVEHTEVVLSNDLVVSDILGKDIEVIFETETEDINGISHEDFINHRHETGNSAKAECHLKQNFSSTLESTKTQNNLLVENSDEVIKDPSYNTSLGEESDSSEVIDNPLPVRDDEENILDPRNKVSRKRKKKSDPMSWEINRTKSLRMSGKKYIGFKREKHHGKMIVSRTREECGERKLGPICNSVVCNAGKKRHCKEFSEIDRKKIFTHFWDLSWKEKQVFVACNIVISKPKKLTTKTVSRRGGTMTYSFKHAECRKVVCKKFFLNTLGIKEWMAHNWVKSRNVTPLEENINEDVNDPSTFNSGMSSKKISPKNETRVSEKKSHLQDWFNLLPKLPSHYCRKQSNKLYLEPIWESKTALYNEYKKNMVENGKPFSSIAMFANVFEEMNLSMYSPRKDQCDVCCAHKVKNIPTDAWEKHMEEKNRARKEKDADKKLAEEGGVYCLAIDVQAVKITPTTKASAMYYKTKLCSHNFTVYNLATHQSTSYWFNETEGDLKANTFASCIIHYLEQRCLNPTLPVVIYSDGCTYQNRNQILSNALLHFSIKNNIKLSQKFLIKGHTQTEVDSVHALIERKLKGKDVFLPFEFVKYTKEARQSPFPYDAEYLSHDFFRNYTKVSYYDSIRPGNRAGDPVVTDIHCLLYQSDGTILYKLNFDDDFKMLPRRPKKLELIAPPQLHRGRLPVPESKWKHLQDLKTVIPVDYHSFYDNIPHF